MDFEGEIYVDFLEDVQNRNKSTGEVVEALLEESLAGGRKGIARMPDARAAEAVDHGWEIQVAMRLGVEKTPAGACGQLKLFGSAASDTLGITISPNRWGKNRLMTLINEIADCLTDQMVGNSERRETSISQDAPAFLAVICGFGGLVDVEMVAPTGKLQSVEAHFFGERRKFCERKIGPLAGEESYRSGHSYMQQNSPRLDK
jgi:hypothetical protein